MVLFLIQIDNSLRLLIEERSVDSGHAWESPCGKITSDGTHCSRSIRTEYDPCLPVSMDQVKAHLGRVEAFVFLAQLVISLYPSEKRALAIAI